MHSCIHAFMHSCIHSFMPSFIQTFVRVVRHLGGHQAILIVHEWPATGQVHQTRNHTDKARPKKASKARNDPLAGQSCLAAICQKLSKTCFTRRSVDSARAERKTAPCVPVRGLSTRSCSQNKSLGVSLTDFAGFARLLVFVVSSSKETSTATLWHGLTRRTGLLGLRIA